MNLIVVVDENWGIGRDGTLLTYLPEDMKHFRETTKGKIVVMGRKTLESFPDGKPLKNRVNIVLTRNEDYIQPDAIICHSVTQAMEQLKEYREEDIFIIGGGMIYREFLPFCHKAYVTCLHRAFDADTDFVNLDADDGWAVESKSGLREYNGLSYEFRIYVRTKEEGQ